MSLITATYDDHMSHDLGIVNAAKVSFGRRSEWEVPPEGDGSGKLFPKDKGLLRFLARGMASEDWEDLLDEAENLYYREDMAIVFNRWRDTPIHKSPFNHGYLKFHCQAPIFVARQLVKHEYLPWNEMSGRYIEFHDSFFMPDIFRAKVEDKKQGSGPPLPTHIQEQLRDLFLEEQQGAYRAYKKALRLGLCEEQARARLPLDLMTEWIWSGSVGAFAKMCKLRLGADAQEESQQLARQIDQQARQYFPEAWDALMTNGVSRMSD